MMKFCEKNKGAISVFLCLILLPTLLVGGLTTDAARIYLSKVIVSDAGEMAMNAALAQYNTKLLDEYGLLTMDKKPSEMETQLEELFNESLNASSDFSDYTRILDLAAENFKALELNGSQIYKTEVEKQQIIEYMKYRAPICLTELIFEKLGALEDIKKMAAAMESQMEFAEDMEKVQDEMESAKEALDKLIEHINSMTAINQMNWELSETKNQYTNDLARALLMLTAVTNHKNKNEHIDPENAAVRFVDFSRGVNMGAPTSNSTFDSYMECLNLKNSAEDISRVVSEHRAKEPEEEGEEYDAWKSELERLEGIERDYDAAEDAIEGYPETLRRKARSIIENRRNLLNGYYKNAKDGESLAQTANQKLEKVREALKKAEDSWAIWSADTDALGENAGDMKKSVDEYGVFFDNTGTADIGSLDDLVNIVKINKDNFKRIWEYLEKEKFFGKQIAIESVSGQYNTYKSKSDIASSAMRSSDIANLLGQYINNYEHTEIPSRPMMEKIDVEGGFYKKLEQYCKAQDSDAAKQKKKEANDKLSQGTTAGTSANSTDGYPKTVLEIGADFPSKLLQQESAESKKTSELDGNVNGGSGRKKALKSYKESINSAKNIVNGLDQILTAGIENLYVAEYAMQMFSYYTVDKKFNPADCSVADVPENEIISLSGYPLKDNKGYKGEVEYILWGNKELAKNIKSTVALIFGIRLLLNSFFTFTDTTCVTYATETATIIAGAAPYLIPVVQVIIQLGLAAVETGQDVSDLKEGYGVTIIKKASSWESFPHNSFGDTKPNQTGITLDYSEFLRIFLNINMLGGLEKAKLARIGDCIQLNTDVKLKNSYTMIGIESEVKTRTTFMRKISDMGSGLWTQSDDSYPVYYQSILGY